MKKITAKKIFSLVWKDFKKNWVFLVLATILVFIINQLVQEGIFRLLPELDTFASLKEIFLTVFAIGLITGLISMFFYASIAKESLNIVNGKNTDWKIFTWGGDFLNSLKRTLNIFAFYIIFTIPIIILYWVVFSNISYTGEYIEKNGLIFIGISLILIIIYLVYFGIYSSFTYYILVEGRLNVLEATKKSFKMVSENKKIIWSFYGKIIGYAILLGIIFTFLFGILDGIFGPAIIKIMSTIFLIPLAIIIGGLISIAFGHLYRNTDSEVKATLNQEQKNTQTGE